MSISFCTENLERTRSHRGSEEAIRERTMAKKSIGIDLTIERLSNFIKGFENDFSIQFDDLLDTKKKSLGTRVKLVIPTA